MDNATTLISHPAGPRAPLALVGLLSLALLSPALGIAAEEPAPPSSEEERDQDAPADTYEADASDADTSNADASYVVSDEVSVEGALPFIPTSNTVAAKLPLPLRETPASVGVVDSALFGEQGALVLGDALRNVSGVNVQTGNGVFDFFVVRGYDSISSGLILTDGAPEPETTFYQLYNVERVEVLKGPGAFLYGGSPLAGTVNLVRKQPFGADLVRLRGSFGSYGTVEGSLDANLASESGKVSFRLGSLWQESDGYRDDKASHNRAINPAVTLRWGDHTSLNLSYELVDTEYRSDAGLPLLFDLTGQRTVLPDVPRKRSYQSPFDLSDQEIHRFQADLETRLSDRLTLRNKLYYRQLDWASDGTLFNGVFPSATGSLEVSRSLLALDDEQRFLGNQAELVWRFDHGRISHHLLTGLEIARLADTFTFEVGLLPGIDLFDPVETAREPVFFLPGFGSAADARTVVVAPYVVDQIRFSDKVQLLAGARFDHLDFEDDVHGTSRSDSQLSPMLGVVVSPTAATSFYASAGTSFAPPSTLVVGEERVPEESSQVELGARQSFFGGRLHGSLSLFRLERENIAIPDQTGVTRQTGNQRSRGLELDLQGEIRPRLRVFVAYAYTDAELTDFRELVQISLAPPAFITLDRSGNTPSFAPEHLLSVWVSQRFANGFGLALGGRWVSEQKIAEDNVFSIDGYTTLDASVFYSFGSWELSLNLENLTDEEFLTRGFGSGSVIPAPGFHARSGFSYTF